MLPRPFLVDSIESDCNNSDMAAYLLASYTVDNEEGYAPYVGAVVPVLMAHGAEILVADASPEVREGEPHEHQVVIRFPSKEAANAFYDSAEYQAVIHHRTDNSRGTLVICDELVMPG